MSVVGQVVACGGDDRAGDVATDSAIVDSAIVDSMTVETEVATPEVAVDAQAPDLAPDVESDVAPEVQPEVVDSADVVETQWRWESLPSLPEAIQEDAVVYDGERLWVLGGFQGFSVVAKTFVFDPTESDWDAGPALPAAIHHGNGAFAGGRVWVVGALQGLSFTALAKTFHLDPAAAEPGFVEGPAFPAERARGAAAVAVVGDVIYVLGGFRLGAVKECDAFATSTKTFAELPDLPKVRDHVVAGAIAGKLYVAGGREGDIASVRNEVWVLDPQAPESGWTVATTLPTARGGASAAVLGGLLVVVGGEGDSRNAAGVFPDVEAYDPATDTWTTLPAMKTPRHGTQAVAFDGAVWVPGGADVQAFGATAIFERLVAH